MDLDDTLVALADETRREILRRLASGEARVTELARPFDISLNSVSKHIRILERAGLVRRRVAGREHFLALEPKPFDELAEWINTRVGAKFQRVSDVMIVETFPRNVAGKTLKRVLRDQYTRGR